MTTELVHTARRGAVCILTLDSLHNRNALSSQLLDELAAGLDDADADDSVRAVVLTATGTVFCSGADLSERSNAVTSRLPEILDSLCKARFPIIVRVNGHARAGGLGLIAASDMAVAPVSASFAFSEVRVGVAPAMIMVPALAVTNRRFLSRAMLTGDVFDATRAEGAGLLSDVVANTAELDAWVERIIGSILKSAPGAVAATKALLAQLADTSWSEGLSAAQTQSAELFSQAEAAEGMEAFFHKRTPAWDISAG